jgi:hypothetical protein
MRRDGGEDAGCEQQQDTGEQEFRVMHHGFVAICPAGAHPRAAVPLGYLGCSVHQRVAKFMHLGCAIRDARTRDFLDASGVTRSF